MEHELPPHLKATRKTLADSLPPDFSEAAPPMPAGLMDDLSRRFSAANSAPLAKSRFAQIQAFLARPAFGMAALALVILVVGLPSVLDSRGGGSIRGTTPGVEAAKNLRIVLIHATPSIREQLLKSGDFEADILSAPGETVTGPRVVIDFEKSTITALDAAGNAVHSASIPTDPADLSAAISEAMSRL
jgi:hypothetical protein